MEMPDATTTLLRGALVETWTCTSVIRSLTHGSLSTTSACECHSTFREGVYCVSRAVWNRGSCGQNNVPSDFVSLAFLKYVCYSLDSLPRFFFTDRCLEHPGWFSKAWHVCQFHQLTGLYQMYGDGYPGPHCFKSITIQWGGKTTTATIMDEVSTS